MADLSGRERFAHLFRRAAFGPSEAELNAAISLSTNEDAAFNLAVDNLLNYPAVDGFTDRIVVTSSSDGDTLIKWWLERMVRTTRPLLEKMVFFWHDHFATSLEKDGIDVGKMKAQNEFFRANALGNFETILNGISRDPAMMYWLDLVSNRASSPNENYARELMELFSLGIGPPADPNYSETDIKQATKAFTGYTVDANGNFFYNLSQHDSSTKTVLGQTCESGDQVNHILVTYVKSGRSVSARFLASKLFSFFAYPAPPDDPVIVGFANTFVSSGLSVRALVEAILKSPQFSSNQAYRAIEKAPVEVAVGAMRTLGAERVPTNGVRSKLVEQGQRLFYPPDVGGWPSGRAWINASTTLSRSNMAATIINSMGNPDPNQAGGLPVASLLSGYTTAAAKVDRVLGLLVDGNVPSSTREALIAYANTMSTDEQIRGLFNLVMALPAYQLN
ncbi:MAG TPA: DUF1800 domain-containing protein [Chloroflexota bacterium]|nr:DUF1800 domain-containing protein [Chloroflexota bacterium]